jgi:hypothetical protein
MRTHHPADEPLASDPSYAEVADPEARADTAWPGAHGASPGGTDSSLWPARLLVGGGGGFEQRLLASARHDRMPRAALDHLSLAIGVGMTQPTASSAARASTFASRWSKGGWFGGLGVLAGAGAWVLSRGWGGDPAPTREAPALAAPTAELIASGAVNEAGASSKPKLAEAAPARLEPAAPFAMPGATRASATERPRVAATASKPEETVDRTHHGLRAELRALEMSRGALHSGRTNDAALGLEEYARRFPDGELALEAELLRIDVALARGESARARALSHELLSRAGGERYRDRLDALLGGSPREPNSRAPSGSKQ